MKLKEPEDNLQELRKIVHGMTEDQQQQLLVGVKKLVELHQSGNTGLEQLGVKRESGLLTTSEYMEELDKLIAMNPALNMQ